MCGVFALHKILLQLSSNFGPVDTHNIQKVHALC